MLMLDVVEGGWVCLAGVLPSNIESSDPFCSLTFSEAKATTDDVVNIALRPSPSLIAMGKPKYVTNAYAEAKANAEKMGTKFSGTKYDYYNHPNKEDGTPIYTMEESLIKENYKSFIGGQLFAACRALKIAYNTGTRNMNNAELLSTLDDYFDGKEGKISMFAIVVIAVHSTRLHLFLFVVQLGLGAFGSKSELQKNLYTQGKTGLKKENKAQMKGQSKLSKTLSLVHTKKYVAGAKGMIHFRPTSSGPTSMAMAAADVGYLDKPTQTAEHQLKQAMQYIFHFIVDPRELTKTHETAFGTRAGNNSAGVTYYHPDYDPNQPIDLLRGSLRKLTREEQEEIFREKWSPGMFEQWKASEYYDEWLRRSETLFEGGSGLPINSDSEPESHDEEESEPESDDEENRELVDVTTSTSGRRTRKAALKTRNYSELNTDSDGNIVSSNKTTRHRRRAPVKTSESDSEDEIKDSTSRGRKRRIAAESHP